MEGTALAGLALAGLALGAPKNEVMLPLFLVFLLSIAGDLRWPASRLVPAGLDIVCGVDNLAAALVVKVVSNATERKVRRLDAGEKSMSMLLGVMILDINCLRISFITDHIRASPERVVAFARAWLDKTQSGKSREAHFE